MGVWEFSKSCLAAEGGSVEPVEGGFTIIGADGGTCAGQSHWVQLQAIIPEDTTELGFEWGYQTTDGAWYDPPQIVLNGVVTQLTNENNAIGSGLVTVEAGDIFAFRQFSVDSCCQPGRLTITGLTLGLGEWVSTTSSTTVTTSSTSTVPSTTVPVTNPTTTTVQETTTTSSTTTTLQTVVPSTTTEPPQTTTTVLETPSPDTSTSSTTTTTVQTTTSSSSTTTPSSLPTTTTQAPTTSSSSLPPAITTIVSTTTSTTSLPQTITATTTTQPEVSTTSSTTTTEPEPAPTTTATLPIETTTSTPTTTSQPPVTTTEPPVTTTQPPVTTTLQSPTDEPKSLTQTELLNTLEALSEASTEAIEAIVEAVLTKDLDTSQATLLIATPAVLDNITTNQVEQLFTEITPTELSPDEAEAVVEAVQVAPSSVRKAFESVLNIFQGFADNYVPLNSTVPVSTRRALIAVGAVFLTLAPAPARRIR